MLYYLCAAFTLISSMVSLGFAAQYVRGQAGETAWYALSRSVALFCVSLIPLFIVSNELLFITSIAMILVQFFDGSIGIKIRNSFKTWGPWATALFHALLVTFYFVSH